MSVKFFVKHDSIVRQIWGKSDTIIVIFAGAAAEFALSKAVDWLYFTGRLPSDPLGRLFSTVTYARKIVFSEEQEALRTIDAITAIHGGVEKARQAKIPDWAYRHVLFMLIDYSIRSYEVLERRLTPEEKEEVLAVFNRLGSRMDIPDLPQNFSDWEKMREKGLYQDLEYSESTAHLFRQYRKHLGRLRYFLLRELQGFVVPNRVQKLLKLRKSLIIKLLVPVYKLCRLVRLDWMFKTLIFPAKYLREIKEMDILPQSSLHLNRELHRQVKAAQ